MSTLNAASARGTFEDRLLDELLDAQAQMTSSAPTVRTQRRRSHRTVALAGVGAALVAAVALQVLPGTSGTTPSASAAQFLKKAATTVLASASATDQSVVIPQPDQYVLSVTEDPGGTVVKTWISVSGENPGRTEWISGIAGEVPETGGNTLTPCTLAQSGSCLPEVGYFPNMPTDPSSLLAYLNKIGFVNSAGFSGFDSSGYAANDLAKGVASLLETAYLLPTQRAALFNLMSETPGFTVAPAMIDAIGRTGVGVEWSFAGGSGALIFNSTTYDLLGVRTWPPGSPNLNDSYDGNALVAISVVNSAS